MYMYVYTIVYMCVNILKHTALSVLKNVCGTKKKD